MSKGKAILVLGGARSGKSRIAEEIAGSAGLKQVYIATSEIRDAEMQDRVDKHRQDRGQGWETIEEPLDIAAIIARTSHPGTVLLIDCLTLWLSNLLEAGRDIAAETQRLCNLLETAPGPVVLVSNEVGQGIVPMNKLARQFRDEAGRLHQAVATVSDTVLMVSAGLPIALKQGGKPVLDHKGLL